MCGIVGVARWESWGISYKDKEIFENLLVADSLRGTHGTGAMIIRADGADRSLKIGAGPYALMDSNAYKEFLTPTRPKGESWKQQESDIFMIGHNRYKTTGNATTEHAHPHRVGNILLVHNGTLTAYCELPRFKKFDVDSHALANGIDELGIEEAISKAHGAYSIIYWNIKEKTLNVLRNDKRPLYTAYDEWNKRVMWASEKLMLEWIIERLDIGQYKEHRPEVVSVETDTLYTYTLDGPIPEKRELKGPKIASFHRGMASWVEEIESHVTDLVCCPPKGTVPKKLVKKVRQAVGHLKSQGLEMKIIQEHPIGCKKNDEVVFRVCDYVDVNPEEESFIIMGESPLLPKTSLRFRLKGAKALDALFEHPLVKATIRNIIEYPAGNEQDDNYVFWVANPNIHIPETRESKLTVISKEKIDPYGRKLLPIPVFSPTNVDTPQDGTLN